MKQIPTLILFLALVMGGGIAIGILTAPGDWYAALNKPAFNPPSWIFAPVWTLLYIAIAVAGWRVWRLETRGKALRLWTLQLGLNFLWSPVFFVQHRPGLALIIIVLLLLTILAFIAAAWRRDRIAALLFLPYAAWVGFASVLNAAIFILNGPT